MKYSTAMMEQVMTGAQEEFFGEGLPGAGYGELLAHFHLKQLMVAIESYIALNYTPQEIIGAVQTPGGYKKILEKSTITLINKEAVKPLSPFNKAAERDLSKLRRETGVDVELIPVPPPPPPTAAELLADEVRRDWKALTSDQIRKKSRASKAYALTLDRLANDGTLESSITTLSRAGS